MCCTRLAENTGRKMMQICRAMSSQLKHVSTVGKKLVRQQYLVHMPSQYGELRPTNGRDRLAGLGHPSKFQRGSLIGFVIAATSLNGYQPNFARCLAVCWAGEGATYFPRVAIALGVGPHSSIGSFFMLS